MSQNNAFHRKKRGDGLEVQTMQRKKPPHRKIDFSTLGKTIGSKWKSLSHEARAKYELQSKADKIRYENEKAAYNSNCMNECHQNQHEQKTDSEMMPAPKATK
mmetsp:Transcript_11229/g.13922  ORF Transcript_11229/g.13922 Transcript_11229/m.13922 type:complete len:103 (-) Transcript_11229:12-320(-)